MAAVMIGIDPHKGSHTAVAVDHVQWAGLWSGAPSGARVAPCTTSPSVSALRGPGWQRSCSPVRMFHCVLLTRELS
jgi:hypothetical protein